MGKKIGLIITLVSTIFILNYVKDYLTNYYIIFFLLLLNIFVLYYFPKYFLITYFLFLCFILLFRETKKVEANNDYFHNWLDILFKNKTVFINVFGNICLFIPLGFILKDKAYLGIVFSIIIELLQKILHIGVLDYYDILLNSIGVVMGITIWEFYIWMTRRKRKKKLKKSLNN